MKITTKFAGLIGVLLATVITLVIFFTVSVIERELGIEVSVSGLLQTPTLLMIIALVIFFSFLALLLVKRLFFPAFSSFQAVSEQIHTQAGAIAGAISQQSGLAIRLSSSIAEISSTMEEFSSTASQIAQHSQGVVERADKTLEDTKVGAAEVENLTFKVNDISQNIEEGLEEIIELGRKSKEINKIMEIINNIANQTKLIAFNAALEAASAGEAGKRFGVVAVEIRRLADSVVESTAEIEDKITEIQDSVNRLVMSSEKSSELIQDGQEYAARTVAMLIESVDGVEETADAARQISLSTQQQRIASSQVVIALKDIEEGTRDSTEAIQQSSLAIAELAVLSEQMQGQLSALTPASVETQAI